MSTWLVRVLAAEAGSEEELVARYTQRLLGLAANQLPGRLRQRIDPEDVVQSVYRSFFQRLRAGQYAFEESHDLWRLLAAMTFHKARNAVKFHQRQRRDVRRDTPLSHEDNAVSAATVPGELEPGSDDVSLLYECLGRLIADLPEHYRTIVLSRLQGESIEAIAQHVHRSRRTVLRVLAHVQELAAAQLESSS